MLKSPSFDHVFHRIRPFRLRTMAGCDVLRNDPAERVFAVSGSAAGQQGDTAVVWWLPRRLDHLHVVLPNVAVWRLFVRPPAATMADSSQASDCSPDACRGGVAGVADPAQSRQQAGRQFEPNVANSLVAQRRRWAALFRIVGHQPTSSGVVQRALSKPFALSIVCVVKLWFVGSIVDLSVRVRAGVPFAEPIDHVVCCFCDLYGAVCRKPHVYVAAQQVHSVGRE